MTKLRVFLADDHAVVREGLKSLINAQSDMEVVGEASDGAQALIAVGDCQPDLAVIDISMPSISGAELTRRLIAAHPTLRVLSLSFHDEVGYVRKMLDQGASGYVLKRSAPDDLISAVRSVAAGGLYIDPLVASKLMRRVIGKTTINPGELALSDRERDVLHMVAQGYSNKEIAGFLNISIKTVETYKARASEKLNLNSRVAIMRYAVEQGWLDHPEPLLSHP